MLFPKSLPLDSRSSGRDGGSDEQPYGFKPRTSKKKRGGGKKKFWKYSS